MGKIVLLIKKKPASDMIGFESQDKTCKDNNSLPSFSETEVINDLTYHAANGRYCTVAKIADRNGIRKYVFLSSRKQANQLPEGFELVSIFPDNAVSIMLSTEKKKRTCAVITHKDGSKYTVFPACDFDHLNTINGFGEDRFYLNQTEISDLSDKL